MGADKGGRSQAVEVKGEIEDDHKILQICEHLCVDKQTCFQTNEQCINVMCLPFVKFVMFLHVENIENEIYN